MSQLIVDNRGSYRIEPTCRIIPIASSTYYRAKDLEYGSEKSSLHSKYDDFYIDEIRNIRQQMKLNGLEVTRCTVEWLTG